MNETKRVPLTGTSIVVDLKVMDCANCGIALVVSHG